MWRPPPSQTRNASVSEGVEQDKERAAHHRATHEAEEILSASGHLKLPWYRRLFRRTPKA